MQFGQIAAIGKKSNILNLTKLGANIENVINLAEVKKISVYRNSTLT